MHTWYSRPVLFVTDVRRALEFYVDHLGFTKAWPSGDGTVCQVDRAECEIILREDAGRTDRGRLFVSLTDEGIAELRRELHDRSIPHTMAWWGYDSIRIEDPDGNELLFPLSTE